MDYDPPDEFRSCLLEKSEGNLDKNFVQSVEDACDAALVEVGFKRPRRGTRYLEITSEFLGWVGLNQGNHQEFLRINPFIGIHCVPIMELGAKMGGKKYKRGNTATYAIHLGEICPDVDRFIFKRGDNIEQEARRLSITIGKYAFPWMKQNSNYNTLLPLVESRVAMLGGYPEHLAIGYYLTKQFDKARRFANKQNVKIQNRTKAGQGDYAEFSIRFVEPFMKMLDEATTQP